MNPLFETYCSALSASARRTVLVLFAVLVGIAPDATAQPPEHEDEIEGTVYDAVTGVPLAGAIVWIVAQHLEEAEANGLFRRLLRTGTAETTHGDGTFHLAGMDPGVYEIRIERLGYRTTTVNATVGPEAEALVIELVPAPIQIEGILATGALADRTVSSALRPASVLSGTELQRRLQGTIADALAAEPGMASTSMGPATARPVIRGLSGDRVLLLEDGARVGDMSSSSPDHATAVDASSARRLEVVRGPAALLYGSSALGGIINVIRDEIPSSVPHHPSGAVALRAGSASSSIGGSGSVVVRMTDRIPLRAEAGLRRSGDLRTPVAVLNNTGGNNWSVGVGTAYVGGWGYSGGSFRAYRNDYGIPGGFAGGHENGVNIEMERMSSKFRTAFDRPVVGFSSIEFNGAYTWYRHKEIEPPDILATFYKRQAVSGDLLARHPAWGLFSGGAAGARASWEDFVFGGGLFTPDTRQSSVAAFVYEEISLGAVRLAGGLRWDWVRTDPLQDDPDARIGAIRDRTFGATSASLGLLYSVRQGIRVGASAARAFRTPEIGELYSSGPHLAAYVFEVGNPSLEPEIGTGFDLFVRLGADRLRAEITGYYNKIAGYIYGEKTGRVSRVQLPEYKFQGNDARLGGFEASLDWDAGGGWALQGVASLVRGTLDDTGEPLPLIPPLQGHGAIEYGRPAWFFRAETAWAFRQDRTGAFETATDGYAVINLAAGLHVTLGGRLNVVTASVSNVADAEYRNHLSRVKEIMPEAGRDVTIAYRVVF